LTGAERQRRYLARLLAGAGVDATNKARIAELQKELAQAKAREAQRAAAPASGTATTEVAALRQELAQAKARITEQAKVGAAAAAEIAALKAEIASLKPPLDQAARHLQWKVNSASFTEKTKIVKALTEQTTSAAARHEGLQAWNALRTNKSGGKRRNKS
jgi:predicted  nucleic acid-binding Zn-ribbon protein